MAFLNKVSKSISLYRGESEKQMRNAYIIYGGSKFSQINDDSNCWSSAIWVHTNKHIIEWVPFRKHICCCLSASNHLYFAPLEKLLLAASNGGLFFHSILNWNAKFIGRPDRRFITFLFVCENIMKGEFGITENRNPT